MGVNLTERPAAPTRTRWVDRWMWPLAVSSLAVNVLIVLTGAVVRLTASGLGCPTWPRCSDRSFVPHQALGIHGEIEFGNRMVTFLLAAVAIATLVAAWRYGRPAITWLALALALGVPAQAVLGGISVLTHLNPWVVSFHLLISLAMIALSVVLLRRLREGDGPALPTVPAATAWLVRATFLAGWGVFYLGTVVTGSGPHAGSAIAPRNGLDPAALSQLHTDVVMLLVGLSVGVVLALRASDGPRRARRAAVAVIVVEVLQATVGFVQYFTGLPVVLVALHLLGAALLSAALAWLLVGIRERTDLAAAVPGQVAGEVSGGVTEEVRRPV